MALFGQVLLKILVRDLVYLPLGGRPYLMLRRVSVRLMPTWIEWIKIFWNEWIEFVWVHANLPRPKSDRSKFSTSAPKAGGGELIRIGRQSRTIAGDDFDPWPALQPAGLGWGGSIHRQAHIHTDRRIADLPKLGGGDQGEHTPSRLHHHHLHTKADIGWWLTDCALSEF
ncbi:hypothetical protein [Bradyrhizobium sp. CCGUVB23]|uniref:hypothetical protein n=1 Tax=Bradyrhizobium sp. CCGUVB23 TaxID=2949630 RepID=UPI0020B2559E|nr:hypothetical protein [Bradyrhizobium sp. CCGUVB23]MCP3463122.1 hypothetical protein [Bradyrhizobium sp. CCGUVB23]